MHFFAGVSQCKQIAKFNKCLFFVCIVQNKQQKKYENEINVEMKNTFISNLSLIFWTFIIKNCTSLYVNYSFCFTQPDFWLWLSCRVILIIKERTWIYVESIDKREYNKVVKKTSSTFIILLVYKTRNISFRHAVYIL